MFRSVTRPFASAFVVFSPFASANSQTSQKAITASQLMALQAGNVLPANLVHEIGLRGISFNPNDTYRDELKKAGADEKVLQALNRGKITGPVEDINAERDLIRQLSAAGADIKTKQYDQAVNELSE